jgi:hypothetical protein
MHLEDASPFAYIPAKRTWIVLFFSFSWAASLYALWIGSRMDDVVFNP